MAKAPRTNDWHCFGVPEKEQGLARLSADSLCLDFASAGFAALVHRAPSCSQPFDRAWLLDVMVTRMWSALKYSSVEHARQSLAAVAQAMVTAADFLWEDDTAALLGEKPDPEGWCCAVAALLRVDPASAAGASFCVIVACRPSANASTSVLSDLVKRSHLELPQCDWNARTRAAACSSRVALTFALAPGTSPLPRDSGGDGAPAARPRRESLALDSVRSVTRRLSHRSATAPKQPGGTRTGADVLAALAAFSDWAAPAPHIALASAVRAYLAQDPKRADRTCVASLCLELQTAAAPPLPRHLSPHVDHSPILVMVRLHKGEIRLHVRTIPFAAFECVPHASHVILSVTGHVDETGDSHQSKRSGFQWSDLNELGGPVFRREVLLPCLADPLSQTVDKGEDGVVLVTLAALRTDLKPRKGSRLGTRSRQASTDSASPPAK